MTNDELNKLFPTRQALIEASGIKRSDEEQFIPIECLVDMTSEQLTALFPNWRAVAQEIRNLALTHQIKMTDDKEYKP